MSMSGKAAAAAPAMMRLGKSRPRGGPPLSVEEACVALASSMPLSAWVMVSMIVSSAEMNRPGIDQAVAWRQDLDLPGLQNQNP